MTNGIAGPFMIAAPVTSASAEHRPDDATGFASFASLFAGAAQALVQKPILLVAKPEGTSDLDAPKDPKDTKDADATGDVGDRDDVDQPRVADATTNARLPIAHVDPNLNGVDRSIATLDPALQEKLAKVISRMREETGRDVQVGETYRSQSRQNTLYAQGRSAPGEVVTWTRNSKHTQGRAVDLVVDGGTAGRDAYVTLRRIANEEGLRTLGDRDPGHLELPTSLPRASATQVANAETFKRAIAGLPSNAIPLEESAAKVEVIVAKAAIPAPVARVAQVAPVATITAAAPQQADARVAKPADVGRVATVARAGVASSLTPVQPSRHAPVSPTTQQHATVVANQPNVGNQGFGASQEDRGQKGSGDSDATGYTAAYGITKRGGSEFTVPNIVTTPSAGTTSAHRAAQIIAAHEDAPARPLSQIVMAVDAGNGTTDRIQLDLRGSSLNATIDAGDQRAAQAMSAHKSELVHALTRDGVEVESVEVRAATTVAAATVAAESAQRSSSDSSSNSRFERGAQWQQQQQQQQNRQRSENDRRQQQRDERGGKK